jgi:hypothetical protein
MKGGLGSQWALRKSDGALAIKSGICLSPSCYAKKLAITKSESTNIAKKAVATAIKDGAKLKDLPEQALSAVSLSDAQFAKRNVVQQRVQERATMHAATKSEPAEAQTSRNHKEDLELDMARRRAESQLQNAEETWLSSVNRAIEPVVLKTPLMFTAICMFKTTTQAAACETYNKDSFAKAIKNQDLGWLARCVAEPTPENIRKLELECRRRFEYFDPNDTSSVVLAELVANALFLQTEPKPTLEDFLSDDVKAKLAARQKAADDAKKGKVKK